MRSGRTQIVVLSSEAIFAYTVVKISVKLRLAVALVALAPVQQGLFRRSPAPAKAEVGHLFITPSHSVLVPALLLAIDVEEPLHPLGKLQVILIFSLHQFVDRNRFVHAALVEGDLQQLKIVHELLFELGLPFNFIQSHAARLDHVKKLALYASAAQLLDFC